MVPFQTAHPYEVACLILSSLAVLSSIGLFLVKVSDLFLQVKNKTNGIMRFMVLDKMRHQGFMMVMSSVLLNLSINSVNNMAEPTGQALNWIASGTLLSLLIVADCFFTYRRRLTQKLMVAEYEASQAAHG
jgi:uncharacterized transporter YbjL